jgi:hypothetical protein
MFVLIEQNGTEMVSKTYSTIDALYSYVKEKKGGAEDESDGGAEARARECLEKIRGVLDSYAALAPAATAVPEVAAPSLLLPNDVQYKTPSVQYKVLSESTPAGEGKEEAAAANEQLYDEFAGANDMTYDITGAASEGETRKKLFTLKETNGKTNKIASKPAKREETVYFGTRTFNDSSARAHDWDELEKRMAITQEVEEQLTCSDNRFTEEEIAEINQDHELAAAELEFRYAAMNAKKEKVLVPSLSFKQIDTIFLNVGKWFSSTFCKRDESPLPASQFHTSKLALFYSMFLEHTHSHLFETDMYGGMYKTMPQEAQEACAAGCSLVNIFEMHPVFKSGGISSVCNYQHMEYLQLDGDKLKGNIVYQFINTLLDPSMTPTRSKFTSSWHTYVRTLLNDILSKNITLESIDALVILFASRKLKSEHGGLIKSSELYDKFLDFILKDVFSFFKKEQKELLSNAINIKIFAQCLKTTLGIKKVRRSEGMFYIDVAERAADEKDAKLDIPLETLIGANEELLGSLSNLTNCF